MSSGKAGTDGHHCHPPEAGGGSGHRCHCHQRAGAGVVVAVVVPEQHRDWGVVVIAGVGVVAAECSWVVHVVNSFWML